MSNVSDPGAVDSSVHNPFSTVCPSCCNVCLIRPPSTLPQPPCDPDPYALCNLLAAGTIEIGLSPHTPTCQHVHAADGWHVFHSEVFHHHVAAIEDSLLLCELEFLINDKFISATCRLSNFGTTLYVRIYLMPYDLPNVQGKLHRRPASILERARKCMRILLPKIAQDSGSWEGKGFAESSSCPRWLLPEDFDQRTMSEIYSDLPSPSAPSSSSALGQIEGMRSKLYSYQRRSVATMAQRETYPAIIPDPLYIPLVGVDQQGMVYLHPATFEILRDRPMIEEVRGGVLCEELGTGKTVMTLALILATLDRLPAPEENPLDPRIVMTPLSFRRFTSPECTVARRRARAGEVGTGSNPDNPLPPLSSVPSLVEILLHHTRVSPEGLGLPYFQDRLEESKLLHLYAANTPFYHHYEDRSEQDQNASSASRMARKNRGKGVPRPRTVWLTPATLIVVPANLIAQWEREIQKHTNTAFLRVLVLRRKTPMPIAQRLASDYDIILTTHARLSAEASKGTNVSKLHDLPLCNCSPHIHSRIPHIPNCTCPGHPNVSSLLQIRWKRLVIDEGHVSAAITTNLATLMRILSVERRWIVTGTPTTNLLGLSFGSNSEYDQERMELVGDDDETRSGSIGLQYPSQDESESTVKLEDEGDEGTVKLQRPRVWTEYDQQDLHKLGLMMEHCLLVPQFVATRNLFRTHIIPLLRDPLGPRPGAIQVLTQMMSTMMIRHRIEDVEKDVVLPPLKQEVVLLDLDPMAVKSYNALQAVIAINAIDSERVDQDYFFHPRNADSLKLVVDNMLQFLFYGISDNLFNVDEIVANVDNHLQTARERNISDADMELLQQALAHMQRVAKDQVWREMHTHEDVPYQVHNVGARVYQAWARSTAEPYPSQDQQHPCFMHYDRLLKLRNVALHRPLIDETSLIELGRAASRQDFENRVLFNLKMKKRQGSWSKLSSGRNSGRNSKAIQSARGAAAPEKVEEVRKELLAAQERSAALAEDDDTTESSPSNLPRSDAVEKVGEKARVPASQTNWQIRIGPSVSSKLNYILNEVLKYGATEKFLIFSNSPLSLAHVAEGLNLIGVKFLRFTTQVNQAVREQYVMTFETSDTYRVFLMELKHGARGLNLVTASRVIFCEPVWQADVESQAIKRAHRIGQTRPISVKTLAIRSTAEENMVARREALKGRSGKLPDMTKETGMRDFIANPKFLDETHTNPPSLDIPLIPVPIDRSEDTSSATVAVTHEEPDQDERPKKRLKGCCTCSLTSM